MKFTLPDLPYDFKALEPHIDAKTMEIHHDKHHAGYVNKLNAALENHQDLQELSIERLLAVLDDVPAEIATAVKNNGGGHYNHTLFWEIMSPDGGGEPSGMLAKKINEDFGSFEKFREEFTSEAGSRFGSGWAWLVLEGDKLHVCSMPNQDNPLMHGNTPILGLDVWEHAYYLKYQNLRPDYIKAWWHVVNWTAVGEKLQEAMEKAS